MALLNPPQPTTPRTSWLSQDRRHVCLTLTVLSMTAMEERTPTSSPSVEMEREDNMTKQADDNIEKDHSTAGKSASSFGEEEARDDVDGGGGEVFQDCLSGSELRMLDMDQDGNYDETTLQAASDDAHADNDREAVETGCYKLLSPCYLGWLAKFPDLFPRTCALLFGVAGPVFLLILISLFFGYLLADLEAPNEIESNNDIISSRKYVAANTQFIRRATLDVPNICLSLAATNQTADPEFTEALTEAIDAVYLRDWETGNFESESPFQTAESLQELVEFMETCSSAAWESAIRFIFSGPSADQLVDLSFDWIRCSGPPPDGSTFSSIMGNYLRPPQGNLTQLRPDVQEAQMVEAWSEDQQALYVEYLGENMLAGMSNVDAAFDALQRSIENADGSGNCEPNAVAGAWFWFTVMTTIGYGNTAPVTTGGRAMVYTFGFLSILTFASVLGEAGRIISALFDDWVERLKFPLLRRTFVACIFWGGVYYSWMLLIAAYTKSWKETRLEEEFRYQDAFWFAFITSTTVGLGDFFLEHEVLLRRDLMVFSLTVLAAFLLLSNFLVKLTEMLEGILPTQRKRNLQEVLKKTDICWHPRKQKRLREQESCLHPPARVER